MLSTIMKNRFILPVFFLLLTYALNSFSQHVKPEITFDDLLGACQKINESKPHKRVDKTIAGSEVIIHGKKYEVRFFSFEDSKNVLHPDTNFGQYVKSHNLGSIAAIHMKYMSGIEFEVFDYRFTKLEDGVYFSRALREI